MKDHDSTKSSSYPNSRFLFQSCSCLWQSRLLINIRVYRYGDNMRILFFVLLISLISLTPPAWAGCTVSYISIKSIKAKFIDTCKRSRSQLTTSRETPLQPVICGLQAQTTYLQAITHFHLINGLITIQK